MKTIGIIAEFNPFHKGHEYFIKTASNLSGADFVIAVMSGDFVQRGEPAIWDKYIRAKFAMESGADLVLELPVIYSTSSAADFSYGAVKLLDRLNMVDELWFGSEFGEISLFNKFSDFFYNETSDFSNALKKELKNGKPYPKARADALIKTVDSKENNYGLSDNAKEHINEFLGSPNNILGLEYCISLKRLNSRIIPKTLKRIGSGYNDITLTDTFCSAAALRGAISNNSTNDILKYFPHTSFNVSKLKTMFNNCVFINDFSTMLRYKILSKSAEELASYYDVGTDIAKRIKNHENSFESISDFIHLLKTKNQTYTHISRCLIHILLSLTVKDINDAEHIPFVRILGLKRQSKLMSQIKKNSDIKLCARASEIKGLCYNKDLLASNLYESVYSSKNSLPFRNDYSKKPIILN